MRGNPRRSTTLLWLILFSVFAGTIWAHAQTTPLILTFTNTTWKYRPNTNAPPYTPADAWTAAGFDDSTWPEGKGLFGFETTPAEYDVFGGFHTFINPPAGANGQGPGGPSAYFRTHFTWSGAAANVSLNCTNTGDDGWIVYLNGIEIYSFDIPATPRPMTWDINTLPNGANPNGEGAFIITNVIANGLVVGDNVIAVELHQQASTSSDDIFGMSMSATLPKAPVNQLPAEPADRTVFQNHVATLLTRSDPNTSPLPTYQWSMDGADIPGANGASYTFTNTAAGDETHTFKCHVANAVGFYDTRTATIQFRTDNVRPGVLRVSGGASGDTVTIDYNEFMDFKAPPETGTANDPLNYAINVVSSGEQFGVVTATAAPNGTSVTLGLSGLLPEGALINVAIIFASDLAGNSITPDPAAGTNVTFTAWTHNECAAVSFEVYTDPVPSSQTTIAALKTNPNYPDHPDRVFSLTQMGFNTREAFPDDSHDNFGGRLRALFIPPVSGQWRFFIYSDDSSELYLNPTGPNAAGKVLIAQETACCNVFSEPGTPRTSNPQDLVAGQAYYLESIYKEGIGGDYSQVAVRLEGDPTPAASLTPIPMSMLGVASLQGVAGSVAITQNPANTSAVIGGSASFTVGVNTDVPVCYQWTRDDVDIPGAVGKIYVLTGALEGDNGSTFKCRVGIIGGATVTSAAATLTVGADPIHPVAVGVTVQGASTLEVSFRPEDIDLDPVSLGAPSNYRIDGVAPLTAVPQNGTNVVLTAAAPFAACVDHTVVITGVEDLSHNVLVPNPTTFHFTAPIVLVDNGPTQIYHYNDQGVDLGTAWQAKNYDDSAWPSGGSVLAWEPGTNAPGGWATTTVLTNFTNAVFTTKPTFYFRTHFNLPTHPSTVTALHLTEVVDDGSVAFINGQQVHLNRMTEPYNFGTLAAGAPEVGDGGHPLEPFVLSAAAISALVQGDNVFAVEVHQSSGTSSDVIYGARLEAIVSACGAGLTLTPVGGGQARIEWSDATFHLESAPTINGAWTAPGTASGSLIPINSGNRFFRLKKP